MRCRWQCLRRAFRQGGKSLRTVSIKVIARGWLATALGALPSGRLARSSVLVMVWQGVRLTMLAAWAIVVARALGAEGYGRFAGFAGLASAVAGFCGLGLGLLMYQRVVIAPQDFGARWKQALVATLASGIGLSVFFVLASSLLFADGDLQAFVLVALSEIVLFPFVSLAAFAFAAHDRMGWSASLPALAATLRMLAVAIFLALPIDVTLFAYLVFHLAASVAAALFSLAAVNNLLRPTSTPFTLAASDLKQGVGFAATWFSGIALSSFDKSLVLWWGNSHIAGLYAAAYRIASIFAMPIDSLVMAAMPRFFREGANKGTAGKLILYICGATIGYAVAVGVLLWFAANLLPLFLGDEFAAAVPALRWLCLLIPLYGLRQVAAQLLLAYDLKRLRIVAEGGALILMSCLAAVLIPQYGLRGSVAMLLCTEGLLMITLWGLVLAQRSPLQRGR